MTFSYVWHNSSIRLTWLLHTCDMTLSSTVWHDNVWVELTHSFLVCDTALSYVWHDLLHTCDRTPSYVGHDPFKCVTWPLHISDTTACGFRSLSPTHCVAWHNGSHKTLWGTWNSFKVWHFKKPRSLSPTHCVTSLVMALYHSLCNMTHSHPLCDMTHSSLCDWLCASSHCVTWHSESHKTLCETWNSQSVTFWEA